MICDIHESLFLSFAALFGVAFLALFICIVKPRAVLLNLFTVMTPKPSWPGTGDPQSRKQWEVLKMYNILTRICNVKECNQWLIDLPCSHKSVKPWVRFEHLMSIDFQFIYSFGLQCNHRCKRCLTAEGCWSLNQTLQCHLWKNWALHTCPKCCDTFILEIASERCSHEDREIYILPSHHHDRYQRFTPARGGTATLRRRRIKLFHFRVQRETLQPPKPLSREFVVLGASRMATKHTGLRPLFWGRWAGTSQCQPSGKHKSKHQLFPLQPRMASKPANHCHVAPR